MSTSVMEQPAATELDPRLSLFLEGLAGRPPQEQVELIAQGGQGDREGRADLAILRDDRLCLSARLIGLDRFLHRTAIDPELEDIHAGYRAFWDAHSGVREGIAADIWGNPSGTAYSTVTKDERHTTFDSTATIGYEDSRYHHSSLKLLTRAEGVGFDAYLDPIAGDHLYGTDSTPYDAAAFLRQVHRYSAKDGGRHGEQIADLIPLADEYYFAVASEAVKCGNWLGLAEVVVGPDIDRPLRELIYLRAGPQATHQELLDTQRQVNIEAAAYAEKLFDASLKVADLFSPVAERSVADAFLRATLVFMYGTVQHEVNGRQTTDSLDLSANYSLPVELMGEEEPAELIDELVAAIDEMYVLKTGEEAFITRGPKSRDYNTYRFSRISGGVSSKLLEYVRPLTGARGDRRLEFGKPPKGIQASHDFRYSKGGFLAEGKHDQGKNGLSIRLDFDGEGDARYLSLDVGSIRGSKDNLGVKIGRFLAWSNQLRARQVLEERPMFNHSYEVFGYSTEDEVAALFGDVIAQREQDSRLVRAPRLSRLLAAAGVAT